PCNHEPASPYILSILTLLFFAPSVLRIENAVQREEPKERRAERAGTALKVASTFANFATFASSRKKQNHAGARRSKELFVTGTHFAPSRFCALPECPAYPTRRASGLPCNHEPASPYILSILTLLFFA